MKNYDQFINSNQMNEGFFDVFKKLFNKITGYYNKIKGGKEVKAIYDKYIALINSEIKKQTGVDLNIGAEIKKESNFVSSYDNFLNEGANTPPVVDDTNADALLGNLDNKNKGTSTGSTSGTTTDNKMTVDTLKKKSALIDKIIALLVAKALKEMDQVLVKYGGAEKNPKLKIIIDNQKDQFQLDYLESKILYLEKAGDKTIINQMKLDRDKLSKDLNNKWNSFDEAGNVKEGGQLMIGVYYRYKTDNGIKTIKIVKQSPNKGKIIATYVLADDGQIKEQDFDTMNIDFEFIPETGVTYNYYSDTNKGLVKVKVDKYNTDTKQTDVTSEKGNTFKAHVGAIRDKVETPTPAQGATVPASAQVQGETVPPTAQVQGAATVPPVA